MPVSSRTASRGTKANARTIQGIGCMAVQALLLAAIAPIFCRGCNGICFALNVQRNVCFTQRNAGWLKIKELNLQLNLFEMLSNALAEQAQPLLSKGQTIFILSLDVVLKGMVNHFWVCGKNGKEPYFGYSIDLEIGHHTVVWDYNISKTVFASQLEAEKIASQISKQMVKIIPSELAVYDCRSFEYYRDCDNYKLEAVVAKAGETQLYEKAFMCYHFLRTYPNQAKRDTEYKSELKKMLEEVERTGGKETYDVPFEELYRVTDTLFASREYALMHGEEYAAIRRKEA